VAFSYDFAVAPLIGYVRLLIGDTNSAKAIFSDEEITAAYNIQASQFQSSMFFSYPSGNNLPSTPVSYLRVAALLLDSLASSKSRLASVVQILDVKLDVSKAAEALRDQAKAYRDTDDDAGAFAIIEQCNNAWSFKQRFWSQVQRQSGGGLTP
jgi:hypothetical protein